MKITPKNEDDLKNKDHKFSVPAKQITSLKSSQKLFLHMLISFWPIFIEQLKFMSNFLTKINPIP